MTTITYRKGDTERCVAADTKTIGTRTIHDVQNENKRLVEVFDTALEQVTHDDYAIKETEVQIVRKDP